MEFAGKTVLVTGAGAGMGKAAALLFAQRGANVIVNSLSDSGLKVCEEITALGTKSIFVKGDVSVSSDAENLIQKAVESFGQIDVVVNAAGIVPGGSIEECDEETWDYAMRVNVKSVYLVSKYALPYLKQAKGVIVNISSTVAIKGVANRAVYSATKGAVLSLSKSMAAEYIRLGVRVNCICPGTVESESFRKRVANSPDPEKAMRDFIERQPMGRLGTPAELAEAIVFAASPKVGFMTGASLVVDGGMTL